MLGQEESVVDAKGRKRISLTTGYGIGFLQPWLRTDRSLLRARISLKFS
jgi:hypothetical protein